MGRKENKYGNGDLIIGLYIVKIIIKGYYM